MRVIFDLIKATLAGSLIVVSIIVGLVILFESKAHADQYVCTGDDPKVCINVSHPDQAPDVYTNIRNNLNDDTDEPPRENHPPYYYPQQPRPWADPNPNGGSSGEPIG